MGDTKKYISIFNDGTNDLYIKDAEAQLAILDLQSSVTGGMHYIGETSTVLTDGATSTTLTAKSEGSMSKTTGFVAGDLVIYNELEFVWSGAKWKEFGSTGSLKSLAFKDASDLETAGSTSQKLVTTSITGVSGSVSVTGVDGSTTVTGVDGSTSVYGCGDNTTVHDTPTLGTTNIYGCGDNTTVHDTPSLSSGTLPSLSYTENTETLTFSAGAFPTLTEGTAVTVATKADTATAVGTSIVAGTEITVATKANSATTIPVAASSATTVPVAASATTTVPVASSSTTVATGSVANDGSGSTVVTSVSTTIQNKATV